MSLGLREVSPDEVPDWDRRAVEGPGGDVYQSLAWAAYRARWGWRPRYLLFDDGFPLLSLERPWPLVGGAGAYLSRGPVSGGEPAQRTAERLVAAADHLARRGVDVVSSDAEIPAVSGYPALIERGGFRPIEEVQPSRHRMRLPLAAADEDALFRGFGKSIRQRVRAAERAGLRVVRYDCRAPAGSDEGLEAPGGGLEGDVVRPVLARFHGLLEATAARRHFWLAGREAFLDWALAALGAGLLVYLEVRDPADALIAGATFYRHGGRWTYSLSGDVVAERERHPGGVPLVLWRAIQLARREGCDEFDLAGVDVPGARREPREGESMYGLYFFKRLFGAEWLELTGNHERVHRPTRYLLGRVAGRVAGLGRAG
ncbi:MAG TPA: GNAT family N-acetyltransferase [Candidatus Limnocylindrales bacterium]